jgi:hypothetical protein
MDKIATRWPLTAHRLTGSPAKRDSGGWEWALGGSEKGRVLMVEKQLFYYSEELLLFEERIQVKVSFKSLVCEIFLFPFSILR